VLVVDDQELVRAGFCVILEVTDGITVVGATADGAAAVTQAVEHKPGVVLMDIRMPDMDGLEAARLITAMADPPKVVMLTTFDLDDYVYEALRSGASGSLLKDSPGGDLVAAIRAAAAGDALLAPSVTRRLNEAFAGGRPRPRRPRPGWPRSPQGTRRAAAGGPRPQQRRDRNGPVRQRGDDQDPRRRRRSRPTSATCWPSSGCGTGFRPVIVVCETGIVVPGNPGEAGTP
jgi:DNA-binding NarL/FixJ family response regulator